MAERDRETLLNSLVDFLRENFGWEFDKGVFDDRFLLQKYVFFAQRLGYPTGYPYNIYVFGAYSPELAQDYYNEGLNRSESELDVDSLFDSDRFHSLVQQHDAHWLEVASTAMLFSDRYENLDPPMRREKICEKTSNEKDVSAEFVEGVLMELSEAGLIE